MTEQLNITSIFCKVALDNHAPAETTDTQQKILKKHINNLFNIAFKYIGQTNRIILVTDNGAAIAYAGQPEDAVLMAKEILNTILMANNQGSIQLTASVGIHLEPVHVVNDFNEQPNIIGNGINNAKQLLKKAQPNEILVSRSYYDNISPSMQALSTLCSDLENTQENHVLNDQTSDKQTSLAEINAEPVIQSQPLALDQPNTSTQILEALENKDFLNTSNWKYALASVFIVIGLFSIIPLARISTNPPTKEAKTLPSETSQSTNLNTPSAKSEVNDNESQSIQERLNETEVVKPITVEKELKQKTKNTIDSTSKKNAANKAISWESFKDSIRQGKKHECTQSEIAMNQCR